MEAEKLDDEVMKKEIQHVLPQHGLPMPVLWQPGVHLQTTSHGRTFSQEDIFKYIRPLDY